MSIVVLPIVIAAFLFLGMCALFLVRGGHKEEDEDT